mmetsp:Transcript_631/g.1493  ORF Transcript_631/g.1493 Transcript_631/m.1493 type:complete len:205 (+) Transcript_631:599-1213(+)
MTRKLETVSLVRPGCVASSPAMQVFVESLDWVLREGVHTEPDSPTLEQVGHPTASGALPRDPLLYPDDSVAGYKTTVEESRELLQSVRRLRPRSSGPENAIFPVRSTHLPKKPPHAEIARIDERGQLQLPHRHKSRTRQAAARSSKIYLQSRQLLHCKTPKTVEATTPSQALLPKSRWWLGLVHTARGPERLAHSVHPSTQIWC